MSEPSQTFLSLFETQCAATPLATAVIHPDGRLSYEELRTRALRLAGQLETPDGKAVRRVAVAGAGLDVLVGLLAGFYGGSTVVPVDADQPRARLERMWGIARPDAVICSPALREKLVHGAPWIAPEPEGTRERRTPADPGELAYVLFTSGSTGAPKGVAVEHASLSSFLAARRSTVPLGSDDVLTMAVRPSFDVFVGLALWGLSFGCAVSIPPLDRLADARYWAALLENGDATVVGMVPSLWKVVLELLPAIPSKPPRMALSGAEALDARIRSEITRKLPGTVVHNAYGPTECTVAVTGVQWRGASGGIPSIGNPYPGVRVHVLDSSLRPVRYGSVGELYIAGRQLARGYLDDPAATAERFVPNPFGPSGTRLYRTGDGARFREDGSLAFEGRLDRQVKLRGHRLELGEIEAVLATCPQIEDATVLIVDSEAERNLCIVASPASIDGETIVGFLAERLPPYMVPRVVVPCDRLPRNPHGKLDRVTLHEMAAAHMLGRRGELSALAEAQGTEAALSAIWQDILGNPVGPEDDFFELGGHSLLAVQILTGVEQVFGVRLPLMAMLTHGTVRELAALVEQRGPAPKRPPPTVYPPAAPLEERDLPPRSTGPTDVIAALRKHPGVADATVSPGDRARVFVTPHGAAAVDGSELAAHLRRELPGCKLPSAIVSSADRERFSWLRSSGASRYDTPATRAYRELLQDPAMLAAVRAEVDRIAKVLRSGGKPKLRAAVPLFIEASVHAEVARRTKVVAQGLKHVMDKLPGSEAGHPLRSLLPRRARGFASRPAALTLPIFRLDGYLEPGGLWRIMECNVWSLGAFIGGVCDQAEIAEAFGTLGIMKALGERASVWPAEAAKPFVEALQLYADEVGTHRGRVPVAAAIDLSDEDWVTGAHSMPDDVDMLMGYLDRASWEIIQAKGRDVRLQDQRLVVRGKPIDWLVILWSDRMDVIEQLPEEHPIWIALREGWVHGVDRFPVGPMLGDKRMMAVLSEPEAHDLGLPPELGEELATVLPWTRLLADRRTDFQGEQVDLLPFAREHQEHLVLKQPLGLGGEGVVLGWDLDAETWQRALQRATRQGWIIQERLSPPSMENVLLDRQEPRVVEGIWDLASFHWPTGEVSPSQARLGLGSVTNVAAGGSLLPVFLEED